MFPLAEQEKLYNPDVATESLVYFTDSNSAGDFGLPTNVANLSTIVDLVGHHLAAPHLLHWRLCALIGSCYYLAVANHGN